MIHDKTGTTFFWNVPQVDGYGLSLTTKPIYLQALKPGMNAS